MDKTNITIESNEGDLTHGPRYERNRKYYLKNTHASLRSTLLHNIKTRGRVPSIKTTQNNRQRRCATNSDAGAGLARRPR